VKDTDFELISPIHQSNSSDDSLGRLRLDPSDGNSDFSNGRFSSDRQIFPRSSAGTSSPTLPDGLYQSSSKSSDSDFSMDAHRQRELRWISIMTTVPAAQSRTNKKVKKLLMDGVPSSVRFLVWTHLTDSKYRGVPGIYSQLVTRGKASLLAGVERDIQTCLDDQPRLRGTRGSALSLMQAYLAMVPDIQYQRGEKSFCGGVTIPDLHAIAISTGLTLIVGHLLLLSPEEEAFWIFVAVMDTHLRPYYSSSSVQVEVDASLFSKALEICDPPLSRKIFFDLGIDPTAICRPW
jgi:TBC1 domain family member 10